MSIKPFRMIFAVAALAALLLATAACSDNEDETTDVPTDAPTTEVTAPATTVPTGVAATVPNPAPTATTTATPIATKTPDGSPTNPPEATATITQDATQPVETVAASPTALPASPTSGPTAGLHVVNTGTYTDAFGNFHVVGEIQNSDKKILTNMQLTIVIKDASGNSLLRNSSDNVVDSLTFNPMLTNLAPDEYSPFDFTLDSGAGTPDKNSVSVTVTGQNTSGITQANYEIRHAQLKPGGADSFYVTGEIANKTDKPIVIRDLAIGLLDKDKKVIAADYSVDYAIYLQPAGNTDQRDASPFYLRINNPGSEPADWKTYVDTEVVDQPQKYDLQIKITNNYFDDVGNFHIVGTVTNNSSETLTTQIVAGLYDKDGVVLDAYSTSSPVNLAAKEELPYDISSFTNVNSNPDEASRLDTFTVQIDDYFTFPSSIETAILISSNESIDKFNNQWMIQGKATNSSKKALSSEIVMVSIYDTANFLVAVNYEWISPTGDSISDGEITSYGIVVILDPNTDTTGYTYRVLVKGEVK
jgi:hypothetical protein